MLQATCANAASPHTPISRPSADSDGFRANLHDRRLRARFPIRLPFHYRNPEGTSKGRGWTVNMSRSGVLVACRHRVRTGDTVLLWVDWPAVSNEGRPVRLFATGKVVRCEPAAFAIGGCRLKFQALDARIPGSRPTAIEALGFGRARN